MSRRRAALLFTLVAAWVTAMVLFELRAAIPSAKPPAVATSAPSHPPLTRHLALVIVDGLRYDIGVDPAVMPYFAAEMRRRSSGEIWAGPITMTSSAVLAYSAGKRGDLDQIVNNETERPLLYDNLVARAHQVGLRLAAAGDIAWFRFHPGAWDLAHPDPDGVAIDVDYDDEIFAAVRGFIAARPQPNLLVAHFVTPDHQAHAYGVKSSAYRAHMRGFDTKLHALLASLGPQFTVFVTSDHGATDNGKHGTDGAIQRRSPLFAYGPGIGGGRHPTEPLDQLDLAATFAYLLGLPAPSQDEGHLLARWLDLPPSEQAAAACASLSRIERYAAAVIGQDEPGPALAASACVPGTTPEHRLVESEKAVRAIAERVRRRAPAESSGKWLLWALLALLALLLALASAPPPRWARLRRSVPALGAGGVMLVVALWLTRELEGLPWLWPFITPVALLVIVNAPVLWALLWPRAAARLLGRYQPWLGALALTALLASYPRYTQLEGFILVFAFAGALLWRPLRRRLLGAAAEPALLARWRAWLALVWLVPVALMGIAEHSFVPAAVTSSKLRTFSAMALMLVAFTVERLVRRPPERARVESWLAAPALIALALVLAYYRMRMPSVVGFGAWLGLPVVAVWLWRRGRRTMAELCCAACFVTLCRPHELLLLVPSYLLAELIGDGLAEALARSAASQLAVAASGSRAAPPGRPLGSHGVMVPPAVVWALVATLFGLLFVVRVGVQSGLDFAHIDWAAGTFDAQHVSYPRVATAVASKHLLAIAAVLFASLRPLGRRLRAAVMWGLLAAALARSLALCAMLFVCRRSFWTSLRVLGDLPHAELTVGALALGCALVLSHRAEPGSTADEVAA